MSFINTLDSWHSRAVKNIGELRIRRPEYKSALKTISYAYQDGVRNSSTIEVELQARGLPRLWDVVLTFFSSGIHFTVYLISAACLASVLRILGRVS